MGSDLRYVLRGLRRSPGFTVVAVLSLAIGIGANAAIFGVVRTLLLTPLAVEDPEELRLVTWTREGTVSIGQTGSTTYRDPETGESLRSNFSAPLRRALLPATDQLGAELFAFAFLRGVSVAAGDQPAVLAGGALADGRYFRGLRVPMALGRALTEADDAPDAPLAAVLSHDFWMRAFGGDPGMIGRTVRVNGTTAEVVGVTAEGFHGLSLGGFFPQTDITVPLAAQPRVYGRLSGDGSLFTSDDTFWLRLMARIPEGGSAAATEQALTAALRSTPSPLVGGDGHLPEIRLIDGAHGAQPVRPETARLLFFLLGVVGAVLLIACLNLSSLMLARGVARQQETAVRRALGGGQARLVRQVLLEVAVLAAAGMAAGLALTYATRELLRDLLAGSLGSAAFGDLDMKVALDPVVLAVCLGLALVATLGSGLLPALRLSRLDPAAWLTQRGAVGGRRRLGAGQALIALQIAVSVPLLVGAALFLRTVSNLGSVELGFDPRGVVSFQVDPGYTDLPEEAYPRLYQELLASIDALPGVHSVTVVENALLGGITSSGNVEVDGTSHLVYRNAIGSAFEETMDVRRLAGRMPGLQDGPDAPRVAVVNETAVRELFGGASPIGSVVRAGEAEIEIVGVVADMPYRSRRDPVPPTLYESAFQRSGYGGHHVVLRTDVPIARLEQALRDVVARIDPDVPVPAVRAQTDIIAGTTARERVFAQLLTLFGGFALLLASIGLYGLTSYAVTRRTSEIGVRVAVGARPSQIGWLVLRQVVVLAGIGLLLGTPAALAASPVVDALLFGVSATSPGAVVTAAGVMVAVAVLAGLWPALRAARLDPLVALRIE